MVVVVCRHFLKDVLDVIEIVEWVMGGPSVSVTNRLSDTIYHR